MSKRDITGFINLLKRIKNELDAPISAEFLISKGFSKAVRYFSQRDGQFRVYYEIDGYDCNILISPAPQVIHGMTPRQQVDEFSDIKKLENHHYGDWQMYINTIDNHLTTLSYQLELIQLMSICKTPLNTV